MKKLETGYDSRRKNFSRGKIPYIYIPGSVIIPITICESGDASEPRTYEMQGRIQTS